MAQARLFKSEAAVRCIYTAFASLLCFVLVWSRHLPYLRVTSSAAKKPSAEEPQQAMLVPLFHVQ
jgi:hypothetical protein